jgi:hypothetical protein
LLVDTNIIERPVLGFFGLNSPANLLSQLWLNQVVYKFRQIYTGSEHIVTVCVDTNFIGAKALTFLWLSSPEIQTIKEKGVVFNG